MIAYGRPPQKILFGPSGTWVLTIPSLDMFMFGSFPILLVGNFEGL